MFGYVKISADNISKQDYELYKSYYCGLCRALGRFVSPLARITLSYEAVFLFILLCSVYDDDISMRPYTCAIRPLTSVNIAENDEISRYCVHVSVIMTYLKIQDNIEDNKSLKAYLSEILFRNSYKKSRSVYAELAGEISSLLDKLHSLEKENCDSPDLCADCFAQILAHVFCPEFIKNSDIRRILYSAGYNLGRWIYLIDAIDDIEEDFNRGGYNPFLCRYSEYLKEISSNIYDNNTDIGLFAEYVFKAEENMLTYTLGNLSAAFELLDIKRNKGILENIIYVGLKDMQDCVGKRIKYEKKRKLL